MAREQFKAIFRFWHFGNQLEFPVDHLAKSRLILNRFNNTMTVIYIAGHKLSIDESMMLWRGRLVLRQYIKFLNFAQIILRLAIYGGQSFENENGLGLTAAYILTF